MIQNKLKSIEDTICWINQEEALFKFPQSSYPDVGDVNVSETKDYFLSLFLRLMLEHRALNSVTRLSEISPLWQKTTAVGWAVY